MWKDRRLLLAPLKVDKQVTGVLFSHYVDIDGEVTWDGFELLMGAMDLGLTRRDVREIFDTIDMDGSGAISFKEFEEFMCTNCETSCLMVVHACFSKLARCVRTPGRWCLTYRLLAHFNLHTNS